VLLPAPDCPSIRFARAQPVSPQSNTTEARLRRFIAPPPFGRVGHIMRAARATPRGGMRAKSSGWRRPRADSLVGECQSGAVHRSRPRGHRAFGLLAHWPIPASAGEDGARRVLATLSSHHSRTTAREVADGWPQADPGRHAGRRLAFDRTGCPGTRLVRDNAADDQGTSRHLDFDG
jgi:hypothetical protein